MDENRSFHVFRRSPIFWHRFKTGNTKRIICFVAMLLFAGSCEREERDLHVTAPSANPVYSVQLSPLVPGTTQPSTLPAGPTLGLHVRNDYEHNAYAMSEGQRLYEQMNCKGCHDMGGGDIGPALMDDQWIYGHEPEQIFATIVQGRPNGMPSYGTRLPEYQIWQLTAYVRSLSGILRKDAAPGRQDHMKGPPPPTSEDPEQPRDSTLPKSAEMPQ